YTYPHPMVSGLTGVTPQPTPFSVPPDGGISFITADSSRPDLTVAHAWIQTTDNATAKVAGIATFGFRVGGVLVTEAGVPAVAPTQSGRVYASVAGALNTGIALSNPGQADGQITFFFTDKAGKSLGSGSFTLPANQK